MHQALYRKYRPAVFDDVCGQKHITDVLRYEVENDRVSHAYLFCGSRGTGKTTCAKILAKAVNCENPQNGSPCCQCRSCRDIDAGITTDVVEMDAASNNGVDVIRELCDEVSYTPAMLKKRVYIIDEVHMLTGGAFNALLKTIEEPPEHVVFILATTEMHKIPATIVSRCQRFDFRRIDMRVIAERLLYIAKRENIVIENEAALLLAKQAQGGMRDAIGLFELCGAGGADISAARVSDVLGLSGYDTVAGVMKDVSDENMSSLFDTIAEITSSSKDIAVFWQELISFVRDMLVSKYSEEPEKYLDLTDQENMLLRETASAFSLQQLIYYCHVLDDAAASMSRTPQTKRMTAELALMKMCRPELDASGEALAARIARLEDKISLMDMGELSPKTEAATNSGAAGSSVESKKTEDESAALQKREPESDSSEELLRQKEKRSETADTAQSNTGFEKVRDISEAVGRLDGTNRGLASFLMSSEAYVSRDGKKLLLKVEGFAAAMFESQSARDAISDAFALAKITDGRAQVSVTTEEQAKGSSSPADELGRLL